MTDEGFRSQFSPWRIGTTQLSSCPSKPNNIDISPSGAALIRCDEEVDIVHIRLGGLAPFLESDDHFVHHRDAGKRTDTFHSSIFIGDVPTVGINGRVGKDGKVDLMSYEKRFMHAQWAPLEIGPNASPFFATLTTRRDLHLWYAPDNQFTGPWQCFASLSDPIDGLDIAVSSFTFLEPTSVNIQEETVYLMATCQDENRAIIWQIQPYEWIGSPLEMKVVYNGRIDGVNLKEIYLLQSIRLEQSQSREKTPYHLIAAVGPKGLDILRFDSNSSQLSRSSWPNDNAEGLYSSTFANTYINHAQWSERTMCLYLCAAGQLFEVDFHYFDKGGDLPSCTRLIFTTLDKDGEQVPNLNPVIGMQLDQGTQHEITITLKDGTMYRCKEGFTRKTQAILPSGEIEAPNAELQVLQRDVEKKRGMYAFQSDDCGVAFMNFDNNDLSAWSFIQHPTSTLEVAFTEARIAGINQNEGVGPLSKAQAIINEFIHLGEYGNAAEMSLQSIARRSKLKRFLSLHTERAIDKAPIFSYCGLVIKKCGEEEPFRLASAVQLIYWLKSFNGVELDKATFESIGTIVANYELRLAREVVRDRMNYIISLLDAPDREDFDDFSELHCMRIAAIAFSISYGTQDEDLKTIETLLAGMKGTNLGRKWIHEWKNKFDASPETGIDVGERCPICDTPVLVGLSSPFEASCKDGHKWNRCSTSFGLLCNVRASACIVCCHQSILPDDVTNDLQKKALEACFRCALCGGTKVTI